MAHVLIPTDLSENARNAAIFAVQLFGAEGNTFTLLNAYGTPHGTSGNLVDIRPEMARASAEGLERFAMDLEEALPDHAIKYNERCEHGQLRAVIVRLEKEPDAPDVIVMGTQGATGLKRVMLGSNTAAVMQGVHTPVLAVPEQATYAAPKRIVLADDGGRVDKTTLQLLVEIARWSHAEVKIVNVVPEGRSDMEEPDGSRYDQVLGAIPHSYHRISGTEVMTALHDLADQSEAGLVVVTHRERGAFESFFHRSVSARLAMHTHIPMLVLHQRAS